MRQLCRPSFLCLALVLAAPVSLAAQVRVTRAAEVRAAPDGNVVADVRSGTSWQVGSARSGWTQVTLTGWVDASRFAGRADSFPESIGGTQTLRLREQPSLEGRILAELRAGAGLRVLERRGTWARIRRDAWLPTGALATAARPEPARTEPTRPAAQRPAAQDTVDTPRSTDPTASATARTAGALRAGTAVTLLGAPTGTAVARLEPGAVVEPVARDRGWVRVRLEGWVAESLLTPADTSFGARITAADLRLDPAAYRGRVVRWAVEVVGVQTADALRRDLAADEPYLLAMGPGTENAILYIAVPPSLLAEARALAPLAKVLITARVRSGRSEPTGSPVLELLSLVKR